MFPGWVGFGSPLFLSVPDSEERRWLPFAGNLPLENRAPFGRLFGISKDIDFMPEGL
jgi:hypothetical protein